MLTRRQALGGLLAAGGSLLLPDVALASRRRRRFGPGGIQYVGGFSQAWENTTSPNLDLSSIAGGIGGPILQDDLVLVWFSISDVQTGTPADPTIVTSGYTALHAVLSQADSNRNKLRGWRKFMGASPDTTIDLGDMTGDQSAAATVRVYRRVNLTNPLDIAVATTGGIDSGQPDPPNVGPSVTPGCAGVMCCSVSFDNNLTSAEVVSETDAYATPSGGHAGTGILSGHLLNMALGASLDPTTSGGSSNTANCWNAATLLLRPA